MKNKAWVHVLICWVFFSLVGCQSSDDGRLRVVGRSASVRPAWITTKLVLEPKDRKGFTSYLKSKVYRPDLGIKQAQAEGLEAVAQNFHELFAQYALELAVQGLENQKKEASWKAPDHEAKKLFLDQARIASAPFGPPASQVGQVYWEEVEFLQSEQVTGDSLVRHYEIWVLVEFPRSEVIDRLTTLIQNLEETPNQALGSLLSGVTQQYESLISGDASDSSEDGKD